MNDDRVHSAALDFEQRNSLSVEDIPKESPARRETRQAPSHGGGITSYLVAAGGAIGFALRTASCLFLLPVEGRPERVGQQERLPQ